MTYANAFMFVGWHLTSCSNPIPDCKQGRVEHNARVQLSSSGSDVIDSYVGLLCTLLPCASNAAEHQTPWQMATPSRTKHSETLPLSNQDACQLSPFYVAYATAITARSHSICSCTLSIHLFSILRLLHNHVALRRQALFSG